MQTNTFVFRVDRIVGRFQRIEHHIIQLPKSDMVITMLSHG
jgi:hypothetical protein